MSLTRKMAVHVFHGADRSNHANPEPLGFLLVLRDEYGGMAHFAIDSWGEFDQLKLLLPADLNKWPGSVLNVSVS